MRTKEARFFISNSKNNFEDIDIDTKSDLDLARTLKMNY